LTRVLIFLQLRYPKPLKREDMKTKIIVLQPTGGTREEICKLIASQFPDVEVCGCSYPETLMKALSACIVHYPGTIRVITGNVFNNVPCAVTLAKGLRVYCNALGKSIIIEYYSSVPLSETEKMCFDHVIMKDLDDRDHKNLMNVLVTELTEQLQAA
jgi:hypothetical protein